MVELQGGEPVRLGDEVIADLDVADPGQKRPWRYHPRNRKRRTTWMGRLPSLTAIAACGQFLED